MLNYVVTSNHVHLRVKGTGAGVIASSIQLVAARSAQEYNLRRSRCGAFWENRYHATAVEADEYLHRCQVYIDLNMVRAGVVKHPQAWPHGGYREIQDPRKRYALIELEELGNLCGFGDVASFQRAHRRWVSEALASGASKRNDCWSEALVVNSAKFVGKVRRELGVKARYRHIDATEGSYVLREPLGAYSGISTEEYDLLRPKNAAF